MNPYARISKSILIALSSFGSVLLLAVLLNQAATPITHASPSTYTVDRVDDVVAAAACLDANANDCSLRGAFAAANANAGSTIIIPAGTYVLTDTVNGDLNIYTNTIISGAGADSTFIQGQPGWPDRILYFNNSTVQLSGVTVRYGYLTTGNSGGLFVNAGSVQITASVFYSNVGGWGGAFWCNDCLATIDNTQFNDNRALDYGGALVASGDKAHVTLTNDQFYRNTAPQGGAIQNYGTITLVNSLIALNTSCCWGGGGVYNALSRTVLISNTTISTNTSNSSGAGLYNEGLVIIEASTLVSNTQLNLSFQGGAIYNKGQLQLNNSRVISNTSNGSGGGLYNYYDSVTTVTLSTIAGNSGQSAGGFYNYYSGTLLIDRSLINDNRASKYTGGAIYNLSAMTLTNSTLSGNFAATNGGGIEAATTNASTYLENVTLANNQADSDLNGSGAGGGLHTDGNPFNLINTLIANNSKGNGSAPDCSGAITSLGYNLILSTTGCTLSGTLTGVITNTDPLIGPLRPSGNSGSTWTHALLPNSPAIDAGDPANCPPTDQRNVARPIGPRCDIGAYEAPRWVYLPLVLK